MLVEIDPNINVTECYRMYCDAHHIDYDPMCANAILYENSITEWLKEIKARSPFNGLLAFMYRSKYILECLFSLPVAFDRELMGVTGEIRILIDFDKYTMIKIIVYDKDHLCIAMEENEA